MRLAAAFVPLLLAACAPAPAGMGSQQASELLSRTAGAPQRCVPIESTTALRVAEGDRETLLYGSGRVIWANRLAPGCGFSSRDILVLQPIGSSYCRGDLVRSVDRLSHIPGPACVLGDFVPYQR